MPVTESSGDTTDAVGAIPPGIAPGLAVIIPHYNDTRRLMRCLDALCSQDLRGVEVVVADNGSSDPLDAVRAAHPQVRFVSESAKGAGPARNRGVAETTAPVLAFTDSDCLPASDWIAAARKAGERRDGDILGGRIDVFDETPPPRSGAQAFETVFAFDWKSYIETKGFSVTANLVTRRDVFDDTGLFLARGSEDKEWCERATRRGWTLAAAPEMRISHPSRSDWPALRRKWHRTTIETWDLEGRRAPAMWVGRALLMPFSALAHLPRLLADPALNGPGEKIRGAATLLRLRWQRMIWMLRLAAGRTI